MSLPIFGSARIDENGRTTGGKAGDQKGGKEVSTQPWYKHPKGWVVIRFKDYAKARIAAQAMKALCADSDIGYDQSGRYTLRNALIANGWDVHGVDTKVETDCSELVRVCCWAAGVKVRSFTTADEVAALKDTGEFTVYTDSKYTAKPDYLLPGDILVTKVKGHTGIMITKGSKAVTPTVPTVPTVPTTPTEPEKGVRVAGSSVNVRYGPGTGYPVAEVANNGDMYTPVVVDGWTPVLLNGRVCWISSKYTEVVK